MRMVTCWLKALKEIAQAVHRVLDEEDRIVRYGGDEFIVILPRQTREAALAKVARMREAINSAPFLHKEGINARLTASSDWPPIRRTPKTNTSFSPKPTAACSKAKAGGKTESHWLPKLYSLRLQRMLFETE
jgi:diguanylate cyclase (GGDEF)-like protein